jgi:hypothetical protein
MPARSALRRLVHRITDVRLGGVARLEAGRLTVAEDEAQRAGAGAGAQ